MSKAPKFAPDEADIHATGSQAPAVASDMLPDTLYVIPVPQRPFFPGQVQPVAINPQEWAPTLEAIAAEGHGLVGLSYVEQQGSDNIGPRQFPEI
ncbi:MAG TPA: endopeptidase La, partial [Halieaceae bacterium]|nr:endopeptidase La [Halieaceae bacterium]